MRLDCEPRSLELRDRTYIHDDSLTDVCRSLLGTDWSRPDERLAASSAAETVLHQLLHQGVSRKTPQPARGGLAPAVRRRVMDYVDAHLDAPLTLAELAGVAALSTYHFARMFHTSFGEPPHAWARAPDRARQGPAGRRQSDLPASRRPAGSAAPAICRGSSATQPASRRASTAAPAPDAEPARISPTMGHRPPRPRAAVATWSEPAHAPGRRLPPPAARVLARRDHPPARNPLGPARRRRGRARRARAEAACRTASWSAPTGSPNANNCPPSSRAGPAAPWPCWPRCSRWRCSPASAWPWARWATARDPSTCCGRWAPCWVCTR